MADPALANAPQALTAVLQNIQAQPPAAPASVSPADHVRKRQHSKQFHIRAR